PASRTRTGPGTASAGRAPARPPTSRSPSRPRGSTRARSARAPARPRRSTTWPSRRPPSRPPAPTRPASSRSRSRRPGATRAASGGATEARLAAAKAFLLAVQDGSAGWGNANSTALAMQGLIASNEGLASGWTKGGLTPYEALAGYQKPDGPFFYDQSARVDN